MRVTLLEFFGLNTALNNIALAQRKSSRSSVINTVPLKGKEKINVIEYGSSISVFPKDIEVLKKLLEKGKEKAKPIKALNVSLRINASRGWWKAILKFQGVRALFSDSSLLIISKQLLQKREFTFIEHDLFNRLNEAIVNQNKTFLKENLPDTYKQTRDIIVDYPTLTFIYKTFKDNKNEEWFRFFEALKELPFADDFIFYDNISAELDESLIVPQVASELLDEECLNIVVD